MAYKKAYNLVFVSLACVFFLLPGVTRAATLAISPASGTYKVGDVFTVDVVVSSYTQSMNAVSGTISYPKDDLSIVGISKNNSILSTWLPPGATGPTYSTSAGTISFEGVLIGGYTGGPKTVFTTTFKVKKAGTAKLSFKNGTVLANDGKGTDLTQALKPGSYKLALATTPAVTGSVKNTKTPTQTPPAQVAETPDSKSSFVDVTPTPVQTVASAPVVVAQDQFSDVFAKYYQNIVLVGFGVLSLLVLFLLAKVSRLSRTVRQLQAIKKTAPRKRKARYVSQKVTVKGRPKATAVFRGVVSK